MALRVCPGGSEVKASACNAGDLGSIPGSRRPPGEGNGNPLQYSCLENPMDGGAWWVTVCGITKRQTRLSDFTFTFSESGSQTCSILITWELVRNADPPVLLLDQFCKVRNSGDGVKQAPGDSDGRWRLASALSHSSHWHCFFSVNFYKGSTLCEVRC